MKKISFSKAINEALFEEMFRDENVYVLGEDVGEFGGAFGVTKGLYQQFGPKRAIDTPLSEAAIAGAAVGSAVTGMRPIAEIMYIDFSTIAMDQIVNQAAKMRYMFGGKAKVPIVFRMQSGAGTGMAAQHSQSLEAWYNHIPGLKVVIPSTPYDAKGLLKTAIRDDNPIIFIEHKLLYSEKGEVPEEEYLIPLGKASIKREGKDVTIISYSRMIHVVLAAAGELQGQGVDAEVIDLRTIKPLDENTIFQSIIKTGRAVIVHEACKNGGVGGEIIARIIDSEAFNYLDAPIKRVCGFDVPIPYNKRLESLALPTKDRIIEVVNQLINN